MTADTTWLLGCLLAFAPAAQAAGMSAVKHVEVDGMSVGYREGGRGPNLEQDTLALMSALGIERIDAAGSHTRAPRSEVVQKALANPELSSAVLFELSFPFDEAGRRRKAGTSIGSPGSQTSNRTASRSPTRLANSS